MDINTENTKSMLEMATESTRRNAAGCANIFSKVRWKKISFIIPEAPEPSHRPRLCGYRVYVPGAARHQSFFNKNVLPTLKGLFITTPCKVKVDIFVSTPKSFTKTQQILAEMHIIRPWGNSGDVDNFLKTVLDQIQPNEKRGHIGIMADDCLVIEAHTNKYYSVTPRYEVTISYMSNIDKSIVKTMKMKHYEDSLNK